jgi:hypothetical protein
VVPATEDASAAGTIWHGSSCVATPDCDDVALGLAAAEVAAELAAEAVAAMLACSVADCVAGGVVPDEPTELHPARAMRAAAAESGDPFAEPRAEYCLGRVALARGRADTAARRLRRCVAGVSQFDQFIVRHLNAMLARAAATAGDLETAAAALAAGSDQPKMKPYEPEWDLAQAAVLAAELRLDEAADRAAWAAGVAADQRTWNVVLAGYHDAARYGAAQHALPPMSEAAARVDGPVAACYVRHVAAHLGSDRADPPSHVYAKLGITSRTELSDHLG